MSVRSVSPHQMRIRRATPDDAAVIAEISERVFVRTFAPDNDPANVAAYTRAAFGEAIQRAELEDPAVTYLLLEVDGQLAAFAQLRAGATDPAVQGDAPVELQRFYVDHDYHGRGVAAHLMQACIDTALAQGGHVLWLGVWERNARAIRFYEQRGFVDVGAKTFQMGNDLQSDRVMARPISRASAAAGPDPYS